MSENLSDYNYTLPQKCIAMHPLEKRDEAKMMVVYPDRIEHRKVKDLPEYLDAFDFMVVNDSKVIPGRLKGRKKSGGKCEVLLTEMTPDKDGCVTGPVKYRGRKKMGDILIFSDLILEVVEPPSLDQRSARFKIIKGDYQNTLLKHGEVPIPPYIRKGNAEESDNINYQTVYAKNKGSVAAPTAGLHFTEELLKKIEAKIPITRVTLHVGLGTFLPVESENLKNHKMHFESFTLSNETKEMLLQKKKALAVGTTSLRSIESYMRSGKEGKTDLFLYPGEKLVSSLKGILTNFHLPQSTLLMLVSSLIGRERALELYNIAIENNYRFYSYGDCMLILL